MAGCGCCAGPRRMLTSFDAGRTFKTPILKVGVSCIATISNEAVICTEVCIVAAGCGLSPGAGDDGDSGDSLVAGAGEVWVVSGMGAGVVVSRNVGSVEVVVCS